MNPTERFLHELRKALIEHQEATGMRIGKIHIAWINQLRGTAEVGAIVIKTLQAG